MHLGEGGGRINRVLVLGGGSAGFLAAITLKARLRDRLAVRMIRSPEIAIIGVGEGTTIVVPLHLHGYLNLDPAAFHREAQPIWKLGIRFLWGPRRQFDYSFNHQVDAHWEMLPRPNGFYCRERFENASIASALMAQDHCFMRHTDGVTPIIAKDVAYHLENVTFVGYLERVARELGIEVVEDTMMGVEQDERGITALRFASGCTETADLFVDCSGFASALLGKALAEPFESFKTSLFCDRAVVGGWQRGAEEPIQPYTTAETMDAGWCWRIDHEHRINRGYVYSSAFLTDDAAETEFRAKSPKVASTRLVKFVTGHYRRTWVKNVVAIGNAGGFVEPLESTSLGVICQDARMLAEALIDSAGAPTATQVGQFNKFVASDWAAIRQFLAIHYRFNTRLQTPFWRECVERVDLAGASELVAYYRENGPSILYKPTLVSQTDQFGLEGYWALLVGQQVPYARQYEPSGREWEIWKAISERTRQQGERGLSVAEALGVIRSPNWKWTPGFYQM
jgi:tryptophan halogenase